MSTEGPVQVIGQLGEFTRPETVAEDGRRIYVHEESLVGLASRSSEAAGTVYRLLGQVSVESRVSHALSGNGVVVLGLEEPAVVEIVARLRAAWAEPSSALLRRIVVSHPKSDGDEGQPLLGSHEHIADTCYFSSYFTFATGKGAARKMFADSNNIRALKKIKKAGLGYEDLSLVSGRCLALDSRQGRAVSSHEPSSVDIGGAKRGVFHEIEGCFESTFEGLDTHLRECLGEDFMSTPRSVFSRGVLSL